MPILWTLLYLAGCGILSHIIGEALPRRWFHSDRPPYAARKWEKEGKIYEKIGVRKWKDSMLDMSRFDKKMVPKHFDGFPTVEQVEKVLAETCVAESVHFALCAVSPFIWFFWRNGWGFLIIGLVILGNLPYIIIQRYNRPSMQKLAGRLKLREERKQHANTHPVS